MGWDPYLWIIPIFMHLSFRRYILWYFDFDTSWEDPKNMPNISQFKWRFMKYIEFKLNLWFRQIVVMSFQNVHMIFDMKISEYLIKMRIFFNKKFYPIMVHTTICCCKLGTQVCIRPLFQESSKSWLRHVCILLLNARLDFTNSNFCGDFIYVNECMCVLCFIMMKHIMPKICTTNMQNNTRPSLIKICAMTKEKVIEEWYSGNKSNTSTPWLFNATFESRPCGFGQSLGQPIVQSIYLFFWSTKKICSVSGNFWSDSNFFGPPSCFLV